MPKLQLKYVQVVELLVTHHDSVSSEKDEQVAVEHVTAHEPLPVVDPKVVFQRRLSPCEVVIIYNLLGAEICTYWRMRLGSF